MTKHLVFVVDLIMNDLIKNDISNIDGLIAGPSEDKKGYDLYILKPRLRDNFLGNLLN